MLLGVDHVVVKSPLAATVAIEKLGAAPTVAEGRGRRPALLVRLPGPDAAIAIDRLLDDGAAVSVDTAATADGRRAGHRQRCLARSLDKMASDLGFTLRSEPQARGGLAIKAPRIGMYNPWTGGNMDEGWTRWVLEQYGFGSTRLHNADIQAGALYAKFDAIILADQSLNSIVEGNTAVTTRPEYRGGIGDEGVAALKDFVDAGGTLITLGAASDLAIAKFPVPVRNLKSDLTRDQHSRPARSCASRSTRATDRLWNGPDDARLLHEQPVLLGGRGLRVTAATVVARYPNTDVLASGWLRGEG